MVFLRVVTTPRMVDTSARRWIVGLAETKLVLRAKIAKRLVENMFTACSRRMRVDVDNL